MILAGGCFLLLVKMIMVVHQTDWINMRTRIFFFIVVFFRSINNFIKKLRHRDKYLERLSKKG